MCVYCKKGESKPINGLGMGSVEDVRLIADVLEIKMEADTYYKTLLGETTVLNVKIKFCPMCGRDLNEEYYTDEEKFEKLLEFADRIGLNIQMLKN